MLAGIARKRFNHGSNLESYFDCNRDNILLEPIIDDILGERARAGLWLLKHESEDLGVSKGHPDQIWPVSKQPNPRALRRVLPILTLIRLTAPELGMLLSSRQIALSLSSRTATTTTWTHSVLT